MVYNIEILKFVYNLVLNLLKLLPALGSSAEVPLLLLEGLSFEVALEVLSALHVPGVLDLVED